METVDLWLKSLRLHKYTHLFKSLTYEQMLNLEEKYLIELDITKGARNKILVSVKKLNLRQERLINMIDDLNHDNISMKEALTALKDMLITPIPAPIEQDSLLSDTDSITRTAAATTATTTSTSPTNTSHDSTELTYLFVDTFEKVAQRLIESAGMEDNACHGIMAAIVDECLKHNSFTRGQKARVASFKQHFSKEQKAKMASFKQQQNQQQQQHSSSRHYQSQQQRVVHGYNNHHSYCSNQSFYQQPHYGSHHLQSHHHQHHHNHHQFQKQLSRYYNSYNSSHHYHYQSLHHHTNGGGGNMGNNNDIIGSSSNIAAGVVGSGGATGPSGGSGSSSSASTSSIVSSINGNSLDSSINRYQHNNHWTRPVLHQQTSSLPSSMSMSTIGSASAASTSDEEERQQTYKEYSLLGPGMTFELPCLRAMAAAEKHDNRRQLSFFSAFQSKSSC